MFDPFDTKLLEIENHLRNLTPEERSKIADWIQTSKQRDAKIKKAAEELSTSFDTLRVIIKYIMFDLEATRRENQVLRDQLTNLHDELTSRSYYAGNENPPSGMMMLPPAEDGRINLPDTGDFIHNTECDHPYDTDCECDHCEALRDRRQHQEGAD